MPRAGYYGAFCAVPTKLHHRRQCPGTAIGRAISAPRPQSDRFGCCAQSCGAISINSGAVELATAVVSRRYLKLIRMRLTSRSPTKPHLARLIARSAGTQEEIEIAATVVRTLPAGRGVGDFADLLGVALAVTAARLFRREGTEINPTSPQIASSSLLDPTVSRAIRCISASRSSRSELHLGLVRGRCFWPRS